MALSQKGRYWQIFGLEKQVGLRATRLFISARPLGSARKGDFAHCSVVRGARSGPPVSDALSPPVPFFLTPPEGAGGTPVIVAGPMSQKGGLRPYKGRREGQKSGPKRANAGCDSSASALAISGISGVGENPCNAEARTGARGGAVHRMVEFSEPESGWQTRPRAYRSFASFMSLPLRVRQTTCNNRRRSRDRQPWLRSSPSQRAFCQRLALDTRSPPP
jgi:hypothetical protein